MHVCEIMFLILITLRIPGMKKMLEDGPCSKVAKDSDIEVSKVSE